MTDRTDKRLEKLGFRKFQEDKFGFTYKRKERKYGYVHRVDISWKSHKKEVFIQSYEEGINSDKLNNMVGLTLSETKLFLKKAKKYKRRKGHPKAYEHPAEDYEFMNDDFDDRREHIIMTLKEVDDLPHRTHYNEITCTYFEKDDTFTDDDDEVMEYIESTIGEEAVRIMRETDTEVLYVVNKQIYAIYEIVRNLGSYEGLIKGDEV